MVVNIILRFRLSTTTLVRTPLTLIQDKRGSGVSRSGKYRGRVKNSTWLSGRRESEIYIAMGNKQLPNRSFMSLIANSRNLWPPIRIFMTPAHPLAPWSVSYWITKENDPALYRFIVRGKIKNVSITLVAFQRRGTIGAKIFFMYIMRNGLMYMSL